MRLIPKKSMTLKHYQKLVKGDEKIIKGKTPDEIEQIVI